MVQMRRISEPYNSRQQSILRFVKQQKSVTRDEIQNAIAPQFLRSSKATILRDLDLLVRDGKLTKLGRAKKITYSYAASPLLDETIDVEAYFETDPDKRVPVSDYFNFNIWDNLQGFLSDTEKDELAVLNQQYDENKKKISPVIFQKELERLTIELSWKSSRIEGNTYTLLDTERLIREHIEAKGKKHEEAVMILNHKSALDYIYQNHTRFKRLSVSKIEDIHRLLVNELEIVFGIRKFRVGITGTNYRPLENMFQIKEALENLVSLINKTENPLEKALAAVLMISYIQPFEDGNKRTARILGNALLLAYGYCPLSYRSVDEVEYKKAKILFYEQNNAFYFKQLFIEQFRQAIEKYF
jgi:Fic family protein